MFFAYSASATWTAVPDKTNIAEEQERFKKLIRPELDAGKAGLKTSGDLGVTFEEMALKTEFAPGRYLLLRESFRQFVHEGDIPTIEKAFDRLKSTFGSEYALSVAKSSKIAIGRLVVDKKPGAKEFRLRLGRLEEGLQKIADLQKRAKLFSTDMTVRRNLAAAYAALGDWDVALREYASCGDDIKALLVFEKNYPKTGITTLTTADVAEFWWHEAETCPENADAVAEFRKRALKWFKFAIENGTLQGEEMKLAQKRVSEFEWRQKAAKAKVATATVPAAKVSPKADSSDLPDSTAAEMSVAKAKTDKTKTDKAKPKTAAKVPDSTAATDDEEEADETEIGDPPPDLKGLPEELGLKFVACPAARAFWISSDAITFAKYLPYLEKENRALEFTGRNGEAEAIVPARDAAGFCAYLQRWYGSKLPIGLKFRLPQQYEWDFLCKQIIAEKTDAPWIAATPLVSEDPNELTGNFRVVIGPPLTEKQTKGTR